MNALTSAKNGSTRRFGFDPISALRPEEGFIPLSGGLLIPETGRYIPRIAGGARGFNASVDLLRTLDGITFPVVYTDLVNALAAYNRISSELVDNLCYRTNMIALREISPGRMKFERGTEFGRPDRQRAHSYRMRGLPVAKYALGEGYTRDFLLNARQVEIDAQHTEAMRADMENLLYEIMTAVFNSTSYTFEDDYAGPIGVVALYNGDAEVPPDFEGRTFTAPHTHYHATAGSTLAHADILQMRLDLFEHGHDTDRVLYSAYNLQDTLRGMVDAAGNPVFFRNINGPEFRDVRQAPGSRENVAVVNNDYIGVLEGFKVRVLNWLPDNYLFGYNSYGANSQLNPFGFREKTNPLQQGLQLIPEDPGSTYPIVNSFYERWFGVGVINRSNGSVMFQTGSGTYAAPTLPSAT
jgi:hypothetical protein